MPLKRGGGSVSVEEGIDTTTAQGRLTFHIFGALAEFERELARERTMAGLRAARERGQVGGRPRALSEEEIPQVQALMKDKDVRVADICERFGISKPTLYRHVGPDGERRRRHGRARTADLLQPPRKAAGNAPIPSALRTEIFWLSAPPDKGTLTSRTRAPFAVAARHVDAASDPGACS
jgi:hypothetical protein